MMNLLDILSDILSPNTIQAIDYSAILERSGADVFIIADTTTDADIDETTKHRRCRTALLSLERHHLACLMAYLDTSSIFIIQHHFRELAGLALYMPTTRKSAGDPRSNLLIAAQSTAKKAKILAECMDALTESLEAFQIQLQKNGKQTTLTKGTE
jgi:hypothetical protein